MPKISRLVAVGLLLAALGLVIAGCSDGGVTLPTEPGGTVTTQAPDTSQAPDTTTAPEREGEAPWWILIFGGILLVILIVVLARSGKKKDVTVASASPSWKDEGRRGYANSRWLFDHLTEAVAIWRGNAQYDRKTEVGSTAETAHAETWSQLSTRMQSATDHLYALEAAAPDTRTAETARSVVDRLNDTRAAVDARAEARYAYRGTEAEASGQPDRSAQLATGRDREVRASENLSEARRRLAEALTNLSAIT